MHGSVDLDPLVQSDNDRMPLRSRLLAVPELRARYLRYVQQIVDEALDWNQLGPIVENHRDLIDPIVKADTRKMVTYKAFIDATSSDESTPEDVMSLKKFSQQRSHFLRQSSQ